MLSINQIAAIAYDWLKDAQKATTMTAIAMGESGGNEAARGDPVSLVGERYREYACGEHLSFGVWQVFLGVHSAMIDRMAGTNSPCARAQWLLDPNNNARAMHAILQNQGYAAWSVYKTNAHQQWMDAALVAVSAAVQGPQAQPVEPTPHPAIALPLRLAWNVVDMNGRPLRLALEITEP